MRAWWQAASVQSPWRARALEKIGMRMGSDGRLDDAVAAFKMAIDADPRRASVHVNLGHTLQKHDSSHSAESIAAFREAIRLNPLLFEAHYNLGLMLESQGFVDEAEDVFRRAFEVQRMAEKGEFGDNKGNDAAMFEYSVSAPAPCDDVDRALAECMVVPAAKPSHGNTVGDLETAKSKCFNEMGMLQLCLRKHALLVERVSADKPLLPANPRGSREHSLRPCKRGVFLIPRFDTYIGRGLLTYGEWSDLEVQSYERIVRNGYAEAKREAAGLTHEIGPVAINVGAHIGTMAVPLARFVGTRGLVHAFEPLRHNFQLLNANVALNGLRNVITYNVAGGKTSSAGRRTAALPVEGLPGSVTGVTSAYWWGDMPTNTGMFGIGPGETEFVADASEYVAVETIDGLNLHRCDFILLDAQGFEVPVLKGAQRTLAEFHPLIAVENDKTTDEIQTLLGAFGYVCHWHFHYMYNPENFHGSEEKHLGGFGKTSEATAAASDPTVYGAMSLNMLCTHPASALAASAAKEIARMELPLARKDTLDEYGRLVVRQRAALLERLAALSKAD